jgi:hypothetical protein
MCSLLKEQNNSLFTYLYTIGNQDSSFIILINTYAIKGNFIYF